jgi:cell division control protein 7
VPSVTQDGISWREFVEKQNLKLYEPEEPDTRFFPYNQPAYLSRLSSSKSHTAHHQPPPPPPSSSSSDPPLEFPSSPLPNCPSSAPSNGSPSTSAAEAHRSDIENAFDLLEKVLHPESVKRITPRDVLAHPFLRSSGPTPSSSSSSRAEYGYGDEDMDLREEEEDDDAYVPHPYDGGKGRCREYHFRDEVTDVECVRMVVRCECADCREADARGEGDAQGHTGYYDEVRALAAGEGIAIGRNPCVFHRNLAEWGWI